MANRLKGEASFVHEGEELTLAINAEALLHVEDETGIGLFEMISRLGEGQGSLTLLSALLRSGLMQGSRRVMGRADAADLLLRNPDALRAIREALARALPEEEDPSPHPRKAAGSRGNGKAS